MYVLLPLHPHPLSPQAYTNGPHWSWRGMRNKTGMGKMQIFQPHAFQFQLELFRTSFPSICSLSLGGWKLKSHHVSREHFSSLSPAAECESYWMSRECLGFFTSQYQGLHSQCLNPSSSLSPAAAVSAELGGSRLLCLSFSLCTTLVSNQQSKKRLPIVQKTFYHSTLS